MKQNKNTTTRLSAVIILSVVLLLSGQAISSPVINSISPTSADYGNMGFTLSIFGQDFVSGTVVKFQGDELMTNFVSASELEAFIPENYFTSAGHFSVIVENPGSGSTVSNTVYFQVNQNEEATFGISPQTIPVGSIGILIKITGKNFTRFTNVTVNGASRSVMFINANELYARMLDQDLAKPGKYDLIVNTPVLDTFESQSAVFVVLGSKKDNSAKSNGNDNSKYLTGMIPEKFSVAQNYPNPFNPSTTIGFALPAASIVHVQVFNSIGQVIQTLIDGESYSAGEHSVQFNASNLASGQYFYRVSVQDEYGNSYTSLNKMLFVK